MTNKSRCLCGMLVVLFAATFIMTRPTKAQDKKSPVSLYTSVGIAVPMSSITFRKYYRTGWGFNEGLMIKLIDRLSLRTTFNYHWYNFKEHNPFFRGVVYPQKVPDRISARTIGFNADMMFDITGSHDHVHWYSVMGPDFMSFKSGSDQYGNQQADGTFPFRSNTFGWNIGTGIRYTLTRQVRFFGEMDYQINFEKNGIRELIPLSVGVAFYLN